MAYIESRKNLTGSACGIVGLALTFTGLAGAYWPVVIAGLYAAGALIAPPERLPAPEFPDPSSRLASLRTDFATLREYLGGVDLPPAASGRLVELTELLEGLLAPGWVSEALATDPEGIHALARAVHQDIPESVDTYLRTRWWTRLTPGTEPPERALEQQLSLLHREAESLAAGLREAEARRQQTHTRYLEDRGRSDRGGM
ncbi:hypothetical protein LRD69_20650 [Streptomyces sp. JH14]|uniref:hypothetical protein n=1 Tax=Streptomyces sp. JH14 TaxID=2793630 RepID=UPI0023F77C9A|nr:hypothetical protein [Streptomyces sp. JH14]MDF6044507.1 hypothetical protein [Streptomyces sp. JH14]